MANKKEIVQRWFEEPGLSILKSINDYCFTLQMPGHNKKSDKIFEELKKIPFSEEVPGNRDLRGANLFGGVHELDFTRCDFSYGKIEMNFVNCDLTNSQFDYADVRGSIILNKLNSASFYKAKLNSCFFKNAEARNCIFDEAVLLGANFENANLVGSSFKKSNCKRAKFLGADIRNTDFQLANLEEAVFQQTKIDKTTRLEGANLKGLYHLDYFDRQGNLVAKGVNWREASFNESTQY